MDLKVGDLVKIVIEGSKDSHVEVVRPCIGEVNIITRIKEQDEDTVLFHLNRQTDRDAWRWKKEDNVIRLGNIKDYNLLKEISPYSLTEAQIPYHCNEFNKEFTDFIVYLYNNSSEFAIYCQEDWESIGYPYFIERQNCIDWLIEKGFIKKPNKIEPTYRVVEEVNIVDIITNKVVNRALVSYISEYDQGCTLICLGDYKGVSWSGKLIKVNNKKNITEKEMDLMSTATFKVTKIEE